MVMRYGDRGARATSAGIFAYFCMVVLYSAQQEWWTRAERRFHRPP
jgi:hypothetical protein